MGIRPCKKENREKEEGKERNDISLQYEQLSIPSGDFRPQMEKVRDNQFLLMPTDPQKRPAGSKES